MRLKDGEITEFEISPEDAGLPVHSLIGHPEEDPAERYLFCARCFMARTGAYRDAVLLNAAAAPMIAGKAANLAERRRDRRIHRQRRRRRPLVALAALVGHARGSEPARGRSRSGLFRDDWPGIAVRRGSDQGRSRLRASPPRWRRPRPRSRAWLPSCAPLSDPGPCEWAGILGHAVALPRLLKNIYAEMRDDIGTAPPNGNLSHWARQGVPC